MEPSVLTDQIAPGRWESRVTDGPFSGIVWTATNEHDAIDHHVRLVALLRDWKPDTHWTIGRSGGEVF